MKRILPFVVAVALLVPVAASAASFRASPTITYSTQNAVSGNLYTAGGTQFINAPVTGDLVTAGGTITINGRISGDVLAAGGTIQVLGPVSGDVRAVGGTVTIGGHVGGDVAVMAGTTEILPDAVIDGSLTVRGGHLTVDGKVLGAIDGPTPVKPVQAGGAAAAVLLFVAFLTGVKVLAYLGAVVIAVWLWRRPMLQLFHEVTSHPWPSVGFGVLYGILTPIASVLLIMSVIGAVPGIFGILLFITALGVSKILAGILFGAWIAKAATKSSTLNITWLNAILGTIGLFALMLIPVLGWIVELLLYLAIFGAMADGIRHRLLS